MGSARALVPRLRERAHLAIANFGQFSAGASLAVEIVAHDIGSGKLGTCSALEIALLAKAFAVSGAKTL